MSYSRWEKFNWVLLPSYRKNKLKALKLLNILQDCENIHGRTRNKKWSDRTLDLDILIFHDLIVQSQKLTIPHPAIPKRKFVLKPLSEIVDQNFEIPKFGKLSELV